MPLLLYIHGKGGAYNDPRDKVVLRVLEAMGQRGIAVARIDYRKMMKLVRDADFRGYAGIEYEGPKLSEPEGILATKRLLERVRDELKDA